MGFPGPCIELSQRNTSVHDHSSLKVAAAGVALVSAHKLLWIFRPWH